ncbi:hypothetical protein FJY71_08830 [candidate division WOR-3 bacterium]|nr:hypothetical protein [candidate division WOR-3 bacterium]
MAGGFLGPLIHAGLFAQFILLTLFVMSVVTWAVFIRKLRVLRRAFGQTRRFLAHTGGASLAHYERIAQALRQSPLASLLGAALAEWQDLRRQFHGTESGADLMQQLVPNISEAMERAASRETEKLESSLPVLAIITMVAPFLGLLGTVQGVLSTFLSLRGAQMPTLQLIAPGISDALITTVMGLVVAIPAAFFYNYFVGRVRNLQAEMERFASELTGLFRREIASSQLKNSQP